MGKFIQDCADCDGYCNCFRHPEIYKARQTSDRKIVLSRQISENMMRNFGDTKSFVEDSELSNLYFSVLASVVACSIFVGPAHTRSPE